MKQILFREIHKKDYESLEEIIRNTWRFDEYFNSKTAIVLSKVYLSICLMDQTYTQVAVVDGKTLGVIMGKNIKKHKDISMNK